MVEEVVMGLGAGQAGAPVEVEGELFLSAMFRPLTSVPPRRLPSGPRVPVAPRPIMASLAEPQASAASYRLLVVV